MRVTAGGFLGIGTTTPNTRLSISQTTTNPQFTIAYDNTHDAEMRIDSSGGLNIHASNNNIYMTNDNLWVCTGGSNTSNACPSGTPTGQGNLIVANKLGVGTTTPTQQLSVQGLLWVAANSNTPVTMGTATSTFNGDVKILGKLDVSTIDPVYTIDGTKYATYGESSTGVHEETMQTIELTQKDPSTGKYTYAIHFDTLDEGSDLWLFYQITNFGDGWKNLVVSLTPSFDGTVFYKKVPGTDTLLIEADQPGEVSMRLTGDRFDYSKWGNVRPDQNDTSYPGFILQGKPQAAAAAAGAEAQ